MWGGGGGGSGGFGDCGSGDVSSGGGGIRGIRVGVGFDGVVDGALFVLVLFLVLVLVVDVVLFCWRCCRPHL